MEHTIRLPAGLETYLTERAAAAIENLIFVHSDIRAEDISEIRLRADRPISVTAAGMNLISDVRLSDNDLSDCVTKLCRGSVYAHDDTIREGYIRVGEGIRAGVCGTMTAGSHGVRRVTSLCIRIPHAPDNICSGAMRYCLDGTRIRPTLIFSPPGVGKTTLLRAIAAQLSGEHHRRVVMIDTRGELYLPELFRDCLCDVLTGYPRAPGIEIATRTMSPEVVICDELGDETEARQILSCQNTGVPMIAAAHASSISELLARPNIRLLHDAGIFECYLSIFRERVGMRLSHMFSLQCTTREQILAGETV